MNEKESSSDISVWKHLFHKVMGFLLEESKEEDYHECKKTHFEVAKFVQNTKNN